MDAEETINLEEYMSAADAARSLEITLTTLRGAVDKGRLPATTLMGRIYIKQTDLEAYRARTRPTGAKPRGRPPKGVGSVTDEDGATDPNTPEMTTMGEAILLRYYRFMSAQAQAQALRVMETLCVYDSEVRGVPIPTMHIVYQDAE